MALYYFSVRIFRDYIPFGSGFASYGTYASGEYYSPIYAKYSMKHMHGLNEADPNFIADTYYPALAQFGLVGLFLFFLFWYYLTHKAIISFRKGCQKEAVKQDTLIAGDILRNNAIVPDNIVHAMPVFFDHLHKIIHKRIVIIDNQQIFRFYHFYH